MTDLALPQVLNKAFLIDEDNNCQILVGKCDCDDRHFFPVRAYCPRCLAPLSVKPVSGRGHVYAFTTVRRRAPFGLPEPYAIGYVDLAEVPLRVFGLFSPNAVTQLKVGAKVDLKVTPLGTDGAGMPCLRPIYDVVGD